MTSHRPSAWLAVAASCTLFAASPRVFAQDVPAAPPSSANPTGATPSNESAPYDEPTENWRRRTNAPPPLTHGVTTTTTTSAEYNYRAGAEEEREYRPNRPLLVTGAILFAAPYLTGVGVAAQSNLDADKRNYIPLVGPWLDLGQRPCTFGSACSTDDKIGSAFLISSGVAQGVGVFLAVLALGVPEHAKRTAPQASVHVTPLSFARGGGLGAVGTF